MKNSLCFLYFSHFALEQEHLLFHFFHIVQCLEITSLMHATEKLKSHCVNRVMPRPRFLRQWWEHIERVEEN